MLIGKTGRAALAALALVALAGCATQRLERAGQVADAGVAFADAVPAVIQPAIDFAVATYQNAVLSNELRERGHVIERELELQRAALALLGEQMQADGEARIEHELRKPVFTEYVSAAPLPSDWTARRVAAFQQTVDLESLDNAAAAAEKLHNSWIAFAENRLDEADLLQLLKDVEELVIQADQMQSSG